MQSDCSDQTLYDFIVNFGFSEFSQELVDVAFTHSSYTKENNLPYSRCYERLEYLGDAVLKMVVTEYLYNNYPSKTEGELTKIRAVVVSDEILHSVAKKIDIERYIKLGKPEKMAGYTKLESIQACVMEALFGALYLSADKEVLKSFIIKHLSQIIDDILTNKTVYNAKALLQEYTQSCTKELPVYKVIKESGVAHNKVFDVSVSYRNEVLAVASGKTKKQAQQEAAYKACKKLMIIVDKEN